MYAKQYEVILIYHRQFEIYRLLSIHGRIVRQTIVQLEVKNFVHTTMQFPANTLHLLLRKGVFPNEYEAQSNASMKNNYRQKKSSIAT